MRRPACHSIAKKYSLAIITTAQIVEYRKGAQKEASPALAIATPIDDTAFVVAAEEAYHRQYKSRSVASSVIDDTQTETSKSTLFIAVGVAVFLAFGFLKSRN